ncbi:MAG: hypothetical protein DRJ64_08210 [Thermoprotei archaeon]|nr:MAG: hypothetical protein DRJ64_08210 [Thermoprotei archaeon]
MQLNQEEKRLLARKFEEMVNLSLDNHNKGIAGLEPKALGYLDDISKLINNDVNFNKWDAMYLHMLYAILLSMFNADIGEDTFETEESEILLNIVEKVSEVLSDETIN